MKEQIKFVSKRIVELKKQAFSVLVKGIYSKILKFLAEMSTEYTDRGDKIRPKNPLGKPGKTKEIIFG